MLNHSFGSSYPEIKGERVRVNGLAAGREDRGDQGVTKADRRGVARGSAPASVEIDQQFGMLCMAKHELDLLRRRAAERQGRQFVP
jgi:hypothetical protein